MKDGAKVDATLANAMLELLDGVLAEVHYSDARLEPGKSARRLHIAHLLPGRVYHECGGLLERPRGKHCRQRMKDEECARSLFLLFSIEQKITHLNMTK